MSTRADEIILGVLRMRDNADNLNQPETEDNELELTQNEIDLQYMPPEVLAAASLTLPFYPALNFGDEAMFNFPPVATLHTHNGLPIDDSSGADIVPASLEPQILPVFSGPGFFNSKVIPEESAGLTHQNTLAVVKIEKPEDIDTESETEQTKLSRVRTLRKRHQSTHDVTVKRYKDEETEREQAREAARRCRQRKKDWLNELEQQKETLSTHNQSLLETVFKLTQDNHQLIEDNQKLQESRKKIKDKYKRLKSRLKDEDIDIEDSKTSERGMCP